MAMSVHKGTHADAGFHFEVNGAPIEKASLEIYLGRATVVDLSETFFQSTEKHLITREDVRPHAEEIAATSRLLVKTGRWSDSTVFPDRIPVIAVEESLEFNERCLDFARHDREAAPKPLHALDCRGTDRRFVRDRQFALASRRLRSGEAGVHLIRNCQGRPLALSAHAA